MSSLISWLSVSTLRRNHLKGRNSNRINGALAAAGYNFSLLLRWFEELLRVLLSILSRPPTPAPRPAQPLIRDILHERLAWHPIRSAHRLRDQPRRYDRSNPKGFVKQALGCTELILDLGDTDATKKD